MTADGTERYTVLEGAVPEGVADAVRSARSACFRWSCHPAVGRLLAVLAGGVEHGVIGETGTGAGVGLAWLLSSRLPGTSVVTVESDAALVERNRRLFAGVVDLTMLRGDANELAAHGPFDLLILDAPPSPGPLDWEELRPSEVLAPGGLLVKDDLVPLVDAGASGGGGGPADARMRWLAHPELFATEVTVAPGLAVLLARRR